MRSLASFSFLVAAATAQSVIESSSFGYGHTCVPLPLRIYHSFLMGSLVYRQTEIPSLVGRLGARAIHLRLCAFLCPLFDICQFWKADRILAFQKSHFDSPLPRKHERLCLVTVPVSTTPPSILCSLLHVLAADQATAYPIQNGQLSFSFEPLVLRGGVAISSYGM